MKREFEMAGLTWSYDRKLEVDDLLTPWERSGLSYYIRYWRAHKPGEINLQTAILLHKDGDYTPPSIKFFDRTGKQTGWLFSPGGSDPMEFADTSFKEWFENYVGVKYIFEDRPDTTAPESVPQEGRKDHSGKMPWHLLPWKETEQIVKVLRFGAGKYSENNWQKVSDPKEKYFRAMLTHISQWRQGETFDEESGLHHLAHAACNALFLMWFDHKGGENGRE